MKFARTWAMPNSKTFDIKPIALFVQSYLKDSKVSVDPFSGNKRLATYTNDLNPNTIAEEHTDALSFLNALADKGVKADLIILDPPYSARQISECYSSFGLKTSMQDTQIGHMFKQVRDAANRIASDNAVVLSFGWNTVGMGINRGYAQIEIMLCAHGGAHNDTICLAERKIQKRREV